MRGRSSIDGILTNARNGQTALLTLTICLLMLSRLSLADPMPPAEAALQKERVSQATTYVRQQALHGISILPDDAKQVMGWFSGNWHSINMSDDDPSNPDTDATLPSRAITDQPQSTDRTPIDLGTNYHHKGFLPTHDALVMGIGFNKSILNDKLGFTARPLFYGQNWHSFDNFWGSEIALNIDKRGDGLPWGKIALGYIGGNDDMTDHGRGMELHGDVDLTNGFKFVSGLRQNSVDGNSNYLMLRWGLGFR